MVSTSVRGIERLPRRVGRPPVSGRQSTPEIPEDERMVLAAQDGDRTSFGRLYERYARMVHGVLLARVPVQDVDDLTHDVFLRALHRLSTLREIGKFGAWLAAIARNMANDYHRHAVPNAALTDEAPGNDANPPARAADEEYAARVLEVIRSLPDAYRETLILRLVEGMTGPEIAARTGLTAGSVRVNLHRGMQQLRAKLSPQTGNQPEQEAL
ncbi:MAG TPA: RNA polymerase sigma factor [Candidatus Sulfotelmatobacter sp.]|nr:RNA polymerase sigma factor [Candidatus Sulfotelmatobacter sp.]